LLISASLSVPQACAWRPKITGYDEDVVPHFSSVDVMRMFRLSWPAVDMLIRVVGDAIKRRKTAYAIACGKHSISVEKKVLILLYYMGTQASDYAIAHKFGVSDSSVHRCVHELVNVIYEDLQAAFIKWPKGQYDETVIAGFHEKQRIHNVIGAIDGSHIKISSPSKQPADYVNRKNYHSIIMQAVCGHNMTFTDVYVGWPGSVHDARVYRNSPLGQAAAQQPDAVFPNGRFLVGDAAYPLSEHLITPFKETGMLSREKMRYNFCHSSTRMAIERAFGLLKGCFRRLQMLNVVCPITRCRVAVVACILHNVCLLSTDDLNDAEELIAEGLQANEDANQFQAYEHSSADEKAKRDSIVQYLSK